MQRVSGGSHPASWAVRPILADRPAQVPGTGRLAPMQGVALTYHDVVEPGAATSSGYSGPGPDRYKLSPTAFAAHLDALLAAGVAVDLTFDDGGCSSVETIAPLLEQHGLRGRFFVVTDRIGAP